MAVPPHLQEQLTTQNALPSSISRATGLGLQEGGCWHYAGASPQAGFHLKLSYRSQAICFWFSAPLSAVLRSPHV